MHDGWEICRERPRRKERAAWRVYVSLNKRGEIAMNAYAFRRIKEPANVALLYYRAERCIGVKFPRAIDRNFFPVRRYGRDRKMRIIRAQRLLKQFEISVDKTLIFVNPEIVMYDGSPMIVLDLNGNAVHG
jgi:hypothetical protein